MIVGCYNMEVNGNLILNPTLVVIQGIALSHCFQELKFNPRFSPLINVRVYVFLHCCMY